MTYTVEFFALNANELAKRFRDDRDTALEQIQDHLKSSGQRVSRSLNLAVMNILNAQIPDHCDETWADAMSAICHCLAEFIRVPDLEMVTKYEFIEQVGILVPSSRTVPPIAIPMFETAPPHVGFIPCDMLMDFPFEVPELLSESQKEELESDLTDLFQDLAIETSQAKSLADLPPSFDSEEIENTRDELRSIFESVHADSMDLIVILR